MSCPRSSQLRTAISEPKARMDRARGKSAPMDRDDSDGPSRTAVLHLQPVMHPHNCSTGCTTLPTLPVRRLPCPPSPVLLPRLGPSILISLFCLQSLDGPRARAHFARVHFSSTY